MKNPEYEWHWFYLSAHPNICLDTIFANPEYPWDSEMLCRNPNLTWGHIIEHPEIDWDYKMISSNPMPYYNQEDGRRRCHRRCRDIKDELLFRSIAV